MDGNDQPGETFADQLWQVYKSSVVGVIKGHVHVNFTQLNRVVLEYVQERFVDVAFDFTYLFDDSLFVEYNLSAGGVLSQYGHLISILWFNAFLSESLTSVLWKVSAWKSLERMTETRK